MTIVVDKPTPPGVCCLLISDDGEVLVSVTDFDQRSYGGMSLKDAQMMRARARLASEMVTQFCPQWLTEVIQTPEARRMVDRLVAAKGFRVHVTCIGHDVIPG